MSRHVIIVGGGPTGLLTALGLAKAGARVTILEAEPQLNDSPRALVYHYPVLPHLERMGLLQDCLDAGFLRQSFGWHVFSTGEMIEWDCLPKAAAGQALHLHQGLFSRVLARHVARWSNIEIRYESRLSGCVQHVDRVVAEVDGPSGPELLECDFLVGADGANSTVRKSVLGLEFYGVTWPDRYIATNTKIDLSACGYSPSVMQIDQKHGAVICKIDESDVWRVTFVEDPSLPIERLPERIDAMFADHLPDIPYEVEAYAPYRMHQRVADKMRVGRILLVGDAAHVTNPTGGLGLTGGMFDAFALIEALNRVLQDDASHDVLDYYERDRRRIFIEVSSVRASSNLRNLYQLKEGQQKEEFVQFLRQVSASDDLMQREMSFTEQLETRF